MAGGPEAGALMRQSRRGLLMFRCHAQATRAAVAGKAGRTDEADAAWAAAQALARAKGDVTLLGPVKPSSPPQ